MHNWHAPTDYIPGKYVIEVFLMSSLASLEPKIILIHNKISGFKNRLETNFKIILGSTPISFGKDLAAFDILARLEDLSNCFC